MNESEAQRKERGERFSRICQSSALSTGQVWAYNQRLSEFLESEIAHALQRQRSEIGKLRNELYDRLPSGNVDAFHLVSIITEHIEKLDALSSPASLSTNE